MHFRPKKSRYTAILLFGLLAYLANRSTVCLRGGGLRKLSFGENWLTGALIGVEFDRDQHAAHLDQVILNHLWQKNSQKWPKIAIVTVSLPGGPKMVDQT